MECSAMGSFRSLKEFRPVLTLETMVCRSSPTVLDREPVGVEQGADIRADLQHDFVHVGRGVDLVGDRLKVFLEIQPAVDVAGRAQMRLQ